MLFDDFILQKRQKHSSQSEHSRKHQIIPMMRLSSLMNHNLQPFRRFLHNLMYKKLSKVCLILKRSHQILSFYCTPKISRLLSYRYLKANPTFMSVLVEKAEVMVTISLGSKRTGKGHFI